MCLLFIVSPSMTLFSYLQVEGCVPVALLSILFVFEMKTRSKSHLKDSESNSKSAGRADTGLAAPHALGDRIYAER